MRATTLDKLYFDSNQNLLKECLNTFLQNVEYCLANKKKEDALIDDILRNDIPINATLYDVYSKNLRKAVDKVFYEDNGNGLSDCLRANVSRFAAYKAYHATQQVRKQIAKDGDMDRARKVLHAFNRYQAAEYNTTVSRCRTAKQFEEFSAADNMRLFPNLRWLPSRSANPREQHMLFYNRVWAKDDPFWAQNQPGNLWNCKCDWEETSDPVTDDNPTAPIRHDGLEGNPAHTGEIFSDNCAYVKHASPDTWTKTKPAIRYSIRKQYKGYKNTIDTSIGEVLIDEITMIEVSKGSATDKSFFLKQEIAMNIGKYTDKLQPMPNEDVDLGHNNPNSIFYRRKTKFENFQVFQLSIDNFIFTIKMGVFKKNKGLHIYTITG